MNINLGQMANGNTSININVHPNIHSTQPTVTVNGSEQGNTALTILRSLADGDTFSANITDVSGEQVTITLDGGQSFTASLLNSTAYNIGDRADFVIQDNKGENIVLKAVTMQATALETAMINKSLKAAGIMPTLRNREMVLELMRNGMPIGRDALLDMVKELSSHSNAEIGGIIALKRMGIEVTDDSLKSYQNYKEYNGAMQRDIAALGEKLFESVDSGKALSDVVKLLVGDELLTGNGTVEDNSKESTKTGAQTQQPVGTQADEKSDIAQKNLMSDVKNMVAGMVDNYNAATGRSLKLSYEFLNTDNLARFMNGFARMAEEFEMEPLLKNKLHGVLKGDKASRLLNELVRDTFSMEMTDVADSESVKEHIAKTLDKLSSVSEYAASNQSAELSNVASRMSNNMEFLNSMNQFMAAVQVPIKNIGEHGEGELYVYRRNKQKCGEDDTVKAFLHLDMEHLGALDIYLTLKGSSVATNFKVEDESVLDFLEANMEQLTKKLGEDGYNVTASISRTDDGAGFNFEREVIAPVLPVSDVRRFRFDMKA
ncbi:MAG: flagellar hook-length control protein FliK [Lachnospiraceae bacterium]